MKKNDGKDSNSETQEFDLTGCVSRDELFHNETIRVYETTLRFDQIRFWEGNLRTLLAFDILKDRAGDLASLSKEEVTNFLSKRPELELYALAKSIRQHGVRVPLIVKDDGTLLDGNRRYFACSYLNMSKDKPHPDVLNKIPVWIVKSEDLDEQKQLKIIAESNFVNDLKVPWPLDIRAKVIRELFIKLTKEQNYSHQEAYTEIEQIYGLKKSDVLAYVETMDLVDKFLARAADDSERTFKLREVTLKKFVYFWEFRNKALTGGKALDTSELEKVKPLFFLMMEQNRFNNIKEIVPMLKSVQDEELWSMLDKTKGANIKDVTALYNADKQVKSSEDKVRNFLRWYKKINVDEMSRATRTLLKELKATITIGDE